MNEHIRYIKAMREKNNELWLSLLEIALKSSPEEARKVIRQIRINDLLISEATGKMVEEIDADCQPKDRV